MIKHPEPYMLTAGNRIYCRRCAASSGRTKEQCKRPALKNKKVCKHHGGMSTGPKTEEGKKRLRTLNLKHGLYIASVRDATRKASIKLCYLEDIAYHLGMIKVRTQGRKPTGYFRFNLNNKDELEMALVASRLSS